MYKEGFPAKSSVLLAHRPHMSAVAHETLAGMTCSWYGVPPYAYSIRPKSRPPSLLFQYHRPWVLALGLGMQVGNESSMKGMFGRKRGQIFITIDITIVERFQFQGLRVIDIPTGVLIWVAPYPVLGGNGQGTSSWHQEESAVLGYTATLHICPSCPCCAWCGLASSLEDDVMSEPGQAGDRFTGMNVLHWLYRTAAKVKAGEQTDVVCIVYDPDNPFTAAEQACVEELLEPEVRLFDYLARHRLDIGMPCCKVSAPTSA